MQSARRVEGNLVSSGEVSRSPALRAGWHPGPFFLSSRRRRFAVLSEALWWCIVLGDESPLA
jgi:hypothetical protein